MHTNWTRLCGIVSVVLLLAPLMVVGQPQPREARPDRSADRSRGDVQVVNDWRDAINLRMRSDNQERLGEWAIRPGENVVLQERGERISVRPNDTITVGDGGDWVEVGQVGQFRNGTWHVNVRGVWAATHQDRPEGRNSGRGEESPLDQLLKKIK